ncbi:hypothetical protein CcrC1_gp423 [Caulobacter phage C1]|nr:hypothetical protein CcrC1_gp423 [Caulobacter phage C1]UTU08652.1 hypothetical protein CcrC2_gp424 [Caulobacter phage C2]UTU09165.1 hypothetical protein CcrJ4_gp418 [Caulobacter phage J4]UTU10284.1 hypothetical protein CcrRB23_gp422 [Caulobacter phage RB23]WGN97318.1 hypothetical protein [Bertelyvirus sp.]
MTQGPWRCFHCDFLATTTQEAIDHFGYDESEKPACLQVLTETEKAIVEDRRMWRGRALELEDHLEQAHHELAMARYDIHHHFKVHTLSEAGHVYDNLKGEVLALKERVNWVPKWVRRIFTPKGYYP